MAVIKGGVSLATVDVGANTRAMRTEIRPTDVGTLGSYQFEYVSGSMAAGLAAASPIFACRWGDATRSMLLRKVTLTARTLGTAFTAGAVLFELFTARSFTASDTGGTAVTLTGDNAQRKTAFGTSLITDIRGSSTATLTAGTRTLDANAVAVIRGFVTATSLNYVFVGGGQFVTGTTTQAAAAIPQPFFMPDFSSEWPYVFVQNEGFVVRATVPATGVWDWSLNMEWSEVLSTAGFN